MNICAFVFLIIVTCSSLAEDNQDSEVLVLTTSNFDETIAANSLILVEFYAPWCGHCKQLAPEYEQAAKDLKAYDPAIKLAKVDATVETELGTRFEIRGYPTLKFFWKGEPFEYEGPRSSQGIVEYMKERAKPGWRPPPPAVITVTDANFDDLIAANDYILITFFSKTCQHCKELVPKYEKAAKRLKAQENPIPLGAVDASTNEGLSARFNVKGLPEMILFRKGVRAPYKGGREEDSIVKWLNTNRYDAAKVVTSLKEMKNTVIFDEKVLLLGYFKDTTDSLYSAFIDATNDMREELTSAVTFTTSIGDHYKLKPNSIVLLSAPRFYTKYEPTQIEFTLQSGDSTSYTTQIKEFVVKNRLPLVGHFSYDSAKFYDISERDEEEEGEEIGDSSSTPASQKKALCLVFYTVKYNHDYTKATELWRLKIADIAVNYKESIVFAIADEEEFSHKLKDFQLDDSGTEINIGCYGTNSYKYAMPEMDEYDADHITDFLDKMLQGKLKSIIKSQVEPKELHKPGTVKTIVGSSFARHVLDQTTQDVLIEFYAPWCGHCKSFAPEYETFAKRMYDDAEIKDTLLIAKMDAVANDVFPPFEVKGFPTIYLVTAGNKSKPIKYSGNRQLEDLEKFVKENRSTSLKPSKASKTEL